MAPWLAAALVVAALGLAPRALAEGAPVIAVLGDSLTAGLGVAADEPFPARLEAREIRPSVVVVDDPDGGRRVGLLQLSLSRRSAF